MICPKRNDLLHFDAWASTFGETVTATLRHTFATRLCESGINVKVIQDVLGHADISTTMDIYVDVMDELKKREIASFDSYMAKSRETI